MTMPDKKIFISFANKDKAFAESLAKMLDANGFKIWFNGQIKPGDEWEQSVKKALEDSNLFILLVSNAYMESAFNLFELGGAMGLDKKILPIVLSGDVKKMPFHFKRYHVVDAKKTDKESLLNIIEQQTRGELAA